MYEYFMFVSDENSADTSRGKRCTYCMHYTFEKTDETTIVCTSTAFSVRICSICFFNLQTSNPDSALVCKDIYIFNLQQLYRICFMHIFSDYRLTNWYFLSTVFSSRRYRFSLLLKVSCCVNTIPTVSSHPLSQLTVDTFSKSLKVVILVVIDDHITKVFYNRSSLPFAVSFCDGGWPIMNFPLVSISCYCMIPIRSAVEMNFSSHEKWVSNRRRNCALSWLSRVPSGWTLLSTMWDCDYSCRRFEFTRMVSGRSDVRSPCIFVVTYIVCIITLLYQWNFLETYWNKNSRW
jgi:hypothetical protein